MVTDVRAALFPFLQQKVQAGIATSLCHQAWLDIETLENLRWRCQGIAPSIRCVQAVHETGHELLSPAIDAHSKHDLLRQQMPQESMLETALGRVWSGVWFGRGSGSSARQQQTITASVSVPTQSLQPGPSAAPVSTATRFISTERWLVQRCDGTKVYRIQYFGSGDFFHAQVVPTDFSSLLAVGWLALRQRFAGGSRK